MNNYITWIEFEHTALEPYDGNGYGGYDGYDGYAR